MRIELLSAIWLVILLQAVYLMWRMRGGRYPQLLAAALAALFIQALQSLMADIGVSTWGQADWLRNSTYRTLPYLIGPLLLLHAQANANADYRLRVRHLWHAVPYLLSLPYVFWVVHQPWYRGGRLGISCQSLAQTEYPLFCGWRTLAFT